MRYLLLAAAIHVALTTGIFLIGHFRVLPATFDENGIGLTFAIDGRTYQNLASKLVEEWQTNGFTAWLKANAPLHAKLYSLSFAIFGKLLGHNILAAEPLNLFFYLGILSCIYVLGREIFDARTGLFAVSIVGVWPSFLLHSTQLVRDSLSIFCLLALMIVLTTLLKHEFRWLKTIEFGIAGTILVSAFWVARGNMWNVVLAALAMTIVLLFGRMVREDKLLIGNAIVMVVIVAAALLVPTRLESSTLPGVKPPATALAIPSASRPGVLVFREGTWTRVINQIADRRAGFRFATAQASNIDGEVRFHGLGDIVRYLPRAAVIGFFAPFPRMWLEPGSFGRTGRILSGVETLAMYLLYFPVGFCVWRERRNSRMWLLFLTATAGLVGLGLVVVNAGALYRLRYAFWMMLIVLAAHGIRHLTVFRTSSRKS